MGVPAFFRWLSRKYASVIIECVEDQPTIDASGRKVFPDSSKENPNGVEFDNLYLDMNGIIHPCTHPEDKAPPKDEDEMMVAIFECIDRIFAIVRPRRLLYMAIDGVAPRAKMNQQRSRRFRASKEAQEKKEEVERIREEMIQKGYIVPPEKPKEAHFDSNCITPGTPFMDRLSKCLHYYVHERLNNDPGWANIKVVLSDANCPGEGEHKIMDYIRKQRAQPDHDPNTQHVLCGADADLIMLGLATHEPNFTIIREEFKPNKPRPCDICGLLGHEVKECVGVPESGTGEVDKIYEEVRFIFVRLSVLREYLEGELQMPNLNFKYNFDRALDDWVFMCFFVGNDFLPHLPSLEIRENAIDRLVRLYKDCCYKTGGWLTDSGQVNMKRVQVIMENLGKVEDEIFKKRQKRELEFRARDKMKKRSEQIEKDAANYYKNQTGQGAFSVMKAGETAVAHNARSEISKQWRSNMASERPDELQHQRGIKRSMDEEDSDEETPDEVRLYEDGFKNRYYESKFEVSGDDHKFRQMVANEYAVGLCWVLKYYYQGCASWKWYFPYHYAPFASDFNKCGDVIVTFELGTPFNPLEQLMGVFPAASRSHVPEPWGTLMLDPDSNIIDFYPEDFKIDLNGKKFAWQGVALLPFVDELRLKRALAEVYPLLSEEEIRRNVRGDDRLYIGKKHKSHKQLADMYRMGMPEDTMVPLDGKDYEGMGGSILLAMDCVKPAGSLSSPIRELEDLHNNQVVTVRFRDPSYAQDFIFPARKLPGAEEPPRVLKPGDLSGRDSRNYRPVIGFNQNLPRASLGASGHRALGHYGGRGGNNGDYNGAYSNVPPPNSGRGYGGRRGNSPQSLMGMPQGVRMSSQGNDSNVPPQNSGRDYGRRGDYAEQSLLGVPQSQSLLGVPQAQSLLGMPQAQSLLGMPPAQSLLGFPQTQNLLGVPQGVRMSSQENNRYGSGGYNSGYNNSNKRGQGGYRGRGGDSGGATRGYGNNSYNYNKSDNQSNSYHRGGFRNNRGGFRGRGRGGDGGGYNQNY